MSGAERSPDGERPRVATLLAAAVAGAGVGLAVVTWSLADGAYVSRPGDELATLAGAPAEDGPVAAPDGPVAAPEADPPPLGEPDPGPGTASGGNEVPSPDGPLGAAQGAEGSSARRGKAAGVEGGPGDAPGPDERAPRAPEDAAGAATPRGGTTARVVTGRMAYLRCDGAERRGTPYPCPRDEALERRVWAAIDALPDCELAIAGRGTLDLRIEFRGTRQTGIDLRGEGDVDRRTVAACLPGLAEGLETTVPASRTIASFRFRLE